MLRQYENKLKTIINASYYAQFYILIDGRQTWQGVSILTFLPCEDDDHVTVDLAQ